MRIALAARRLSARRGLARQMLVLQVCVMVLVVGVGAAASIGFATRDADHASAREMASITKTLAQTPSVIADVQSKNATRLLQPLADRVQQQTHASFVVFMSPAGIRYTHPNPAEIGRHFVGDIEAAQHGKTLTETYLGTLGLSVRAVSPIEEHDRVVGLVSVGVLVEQVRAEVLRQLPWLIGWAALALLVGAIGSLLLARRVRRQTLGLDPADIARQYQHHDAMLHAVREGLVIIDREGRLVLANDEARRLTGLPEGGDGTPLAPQLADAELAELLCAGDPVRDQVCVAAERVLLLSRAYVEVDGRPVGSVVTLRDRTDIQAALRELDDVRALADSLRTQAHESANKLQAVVGLVELGRPEEAIRLGTREAREAQELSDRLLARLGEPAIVGLLLGKNAVADERGVRLRISIEAASLADDTLADAGATGVDAPRVPIDDVVTVLGNLLDNAIDAAASAGAGAGWVDVTLRQERAGDLFISVHDSGPGLPPEGVEKLFARGYTTKVAAVAGGRGIGLALVRQVVDRLGGTITAASSEAGALFEARLPARGTAGIEARP
jgi:sensor histidine kinase regulating citrate/malate metabolism